MWQSAVGMVIVFSGRPMGYCLVGIGQRVIYLVILLWGFLRSGVLLLGRLLLEIRRRTIYHHDSFAWCSYFFLTLTATQ